MGDSYNVSVGGHVGGDMHVGGHKVTAGDVDGTTVLETLKFCPICGRPLEIHAVSGDPACFMHGDFSLNRDDKIIFTPTRFYRESL